MKAKLILEGTLGRVAVLRQQPGVLRRPRRRSPSCAARECRPGPWSSSVTRSPPTAAVEAEQPSLAEEAVAAAWSA